MSLRRREYLQEAPADIIAQQMGGIRRIKVMIGAKDFFSDNGGKTLTFKFPNRGATKPNNVKITLTSSDLYDVEFGRRSKKKNKLGFFDQTYKKLKTYRGIYNDMLVDLFERETGLYLRL